MADGPRPRFLMAGVLQGHGCRRDRGDDARLRRVRDTRSSSATSGRPVVDKHSTGGVGDAVSLVFAPMVAALGLACREDLGARARSYGRHPRQARVDPGVPHRPRRRTRCARQATAVGCVIAAQTARARAGRRGASTRCATPPRPCRSIPLIAASVMSKKLAIDDRPDPARCEGGLRRVHADPPEARALVEACLRDRARAGRDAAAAITDMSQPLGTHDRQRAGRRRGGRRPARRDAGGRLRDLVDLVRGAMRSRRLDAV